MSLFSSPARQSGILRRAGLVVAVVAATLGTGLAAASSADAAPSPQASVASFTPLSCVPATFASGVNVAAQVPYLVSPWVGGESIMWLRESYCGATSKTDVLTKVCSWSGCSFETWAHGSWTNAVAGNNYTGALLGCRGGTNRYETHGWGNVPGFVNTLIDSYSGVNGPEFTC